MGADRGVVGLEAVQLHTEEVLLSTDVVVLGLLRRRGTVLLS